MSKKRKKSSNVFSPFQKQAVGLAGLTVTTGVSAAGAGMAAAHSPVPLGGMMGGFGTISQAAGTASLATSSGSVLGILKKINKKNKY